MRLSETPSRLTGDRLVPEVVLLLPVVSLERFLTPSVGSKPGLGLLLILLTSAATRAKAPLGGPGKINYGPPLALLAVVALTYRGGPYAQAAVFLAVFLILRLLAPGVTRASAYESLIAGLVLYLSLNILGWTLGFQSPTASGRVLGYETSSPLFSQRIVFPFSTSINELPFPATALLLAVVAMLKLGRRVGWYHWLGVAESLFVLLAANNRTAFGLVAGAGVLLVLAPNALRIAAPYVVGVGLLWPFFANPLQTVTNAFVGFLQGSSLFSRGGTLGNLGGRQAIWDGIIEYWTARSAAPNLLGTLFGYGPLGQIDSGAYLFIPRESAGFLRDRTFLHAHNTILQATLDVGLIGALILLITTVLVVYRYSRESSTLPAFSIALVICLSGAFESALVPGLNSVMFYILIYLAFFLPPSDTSANETRASVDGQEPVATDGAQPPQTGDGTGSIQRESV